MSDFLNFNVTFTDSNDADNFVAGIKDYTRKDEPLSVPDTVAFAKEFRKFKSINTNCNTGELNFGWDSNDISDLAVETQAIVDPDHFGNSRFSYVVKFPSVHKIPVYKDLKIQLVGRSDDFTLRHVKDFTINESPQYVSVTKNDTRKIYIPLSAILYIEEV